MSFRATTTAFAIALGTVAMSGATASAASGSSSQIRAVYRSVLTVEYFGPASAVCSRLTASGVNSFAAGGQGTRRHAFDDLQNVLRHKTPGVDELRLHGPRMAYSGRSGHGPPEAQHPRGTRHRDRSQRNPRSDNPRQGQRPAALQ
jgi:hypothetical protein